MAPVNRFSSRRQRLDTSFLAPRLRGALLYDRIAGYFSSSILEVGGEALESVAGPIRLICNSGLGPQDIVTAKAAQAAIRREWCDFELQKLGEVPSIVSLGCTGSSRAESSKSEFFPMSASD